MTAKKEGSVLPKLHPEPVPDVNAMNTRNEEQMKLINQSGGETTVPQFGKQAGSTNNKIAQNAQALSEIDAQAELDNDINHVNNTGGGGRRRKAKKRVSRRRRRQKRTESTRRRRQKRTTAKRKTSRRTRHQKRTGSRRRRRQKRGGSVKWACMS
jgi:hypothetical protein